MNRKSNGKTSSLILTNTNLLLTKQIDVCVYCVVVFFVPRAKVTVNTRRIVVHLPYSPRLIGPRSGTRPPGPALETPRSGGMPVGIMLGWVGDRLLHEASTNTKHTKYKCLHFQRWMNKEYTHTLVLPFAPASFASCDVRAPAESPPSSSCRTAAWPAKPKRKQTSGQCTFNTAPCPLPYFNVRQPD